MALGLTRLPWYGQIGGSVLLAIAGISAFRLQYERPRRDALALRENQLTAIRGQIRAEREGARALGYLRNQLDRLERQSAGFRVALPDGKDVTALLQHMQTAADRSRVAIKMFQPAAPVAGQMYVAWPINLELDATYRDVTAFFNLVARFARIVNIAALEIHANDRSNTHDTISVRCVATAYVSNGPPSPLNSAYAAAEPSSAAGPDDELATGVHGHVPNGYSPTGRRDPFANPLENPFVARSETRSAAATRAEGAAGLRIDDISVRGVVQSGTQRLAIVQASDGRSYVVRAGDALLDGTVKAVTAEGVVLDRAPDRRVSLDAPLEVRKFLPRIDGAEQ